MKSLALLVVAAALCLTAPSSTAGGDCSLSLIRTTRITEALGRSQTARDNARAVCIDSEGTLHMVWEDARRGNFDIYYTRLSPDTLYPDMRVCATKGPSTHACIAWHDGDVYVLWNEKEGFYHQIHYARISNGEVAVCKRLTEGKLEFQCPVSVVTPDGTLHVAWHEGPYKQTQVVHGIMENDSLVVREVVSTGHPEAFRPDLACDTDGRIMIAWFQGLEIASRLWDGTSWGDAAIVARTQARPWRLSLVSRSPEEWAIAWFDATEAAYDVMAKFSDGKTWYGETRINTSVIGFYPSLAVLTGGGIVAVWEARYPEADVYTMEMRCYDGKEWGPVLEIFRERERARYGSMAAYQDLLHVVYYSPKPGNHEIYHALLRSE